jgi:hypothetical protein
LFDFLLFESPGSFESEGCVLVVAASDITLSLSLSDILLRAPPSSSSPSSLLIPLLSPVLLLCPLSRKLSLLLPLLPSLSLSLLLLLLLLLPLPLPPLQLLESLLLAQVLLVQALL